LCAGGPGTPQLRRLVDADPSLVVWWATRTECLSALARRRREGHLTATGEQQARRAIAALAAE